MAAVIARDVARGSAPVSIDGGMSRNPWFCQFLADMLGHPIRTSDEPELGLY